MSETKQPKETTLDYDTISSEGNVSIPESTERKAESDLPFYLKAILKNQKVINFCKNDLISIYNELSSTILKMKSAFTNILQNNLSDGRRQISVGNFLTKGNSKFIGNDEDIITLVEEISKKYKIKPDIVLGQVVKPSILKSLEYVALQEGLHNSETSQKINSSLTISNIHTARAKFGTLVENQFTRDRLALTFGNEIYVDKIFGIIAQINDLQMKVEHSQKKLGIPSQIKAKLLTAAMKNIKSTEDVANYETLVHIWNSILNLEKSQVYWLDNFDTINSVFVNMIQKGSGSVEIMTCPDYSGFYDEGGIWNYDFNNLGNGPEGQMQVGVVAQKGFDPVVEITGVLRKAGISVNVVHRLPTFEFGSDGFKGYTKEQTDQKLQNQLIEIREQYEKMGLEVRTELSSKIISDEDFEIKKAEIVTQILEIYKNENDDRNTKIVALVNYIMKKRRVLTDKWHPKNSGETEEEYTQRSVIVTINSMADYVVLGQLYSQQPGCLAIDSSSKIVNTVYEGLFLSILGKMPVIHSYSKNSAHYKGD